ncbi:HdeD family acid-resistance protein [Carnobacterium gallinarum]|uniref:HdeD family acid-resistance protein n=1 Tax=Carnobacterium gallinarum TaxID=2749 RepID=UPI00054CEEEA|nr:DUF308 domain-containing protein [Carnobacterium gallinarum]
MSVMRLNQLYLFFSGIFLLIIGIVIMDKNASLLPILTITITGALIIDSLSHFFQFFIKKRQQKRSLLDGLTGLILAAIFYFSNIPFYLLAVVFGAYLVLKGVALLVNYQTYRKNQLTGRFNLFVSGIFQVILGIVLLWSPRLAINDILIIIGLYFTLYGIGNLALTIQSFISPETKNRLKRKIRLTPPVFIEAFVPRAVLKETNAILTPDSDTNETNSPQLVEKKSDLIPDLEIFIHVTEKSYGSIGHMDLCFDGEIISYGNYDEDSYRLFDTVGDGVLISTQKEDYIRFCIEHNQKTLFGFGIQLNEQQRIDIRQKINELKMDCYPWKSHLERKNDEGQNFTKATNPYSDYASCLYAATHCHLSKFNRGKFKTYFVLTTNCVLLADTIIGPSGIDLLTINGILTPGAYLDFLNHEFKRTDSNVITYQVYN